MGGGTYSADIHKAMQDDARRSGRDIFAYNQTMASAPLSARKAHASLDPKGVQCRECVDSADHPDSLPIAIFFDVTGSMGGNPTRLQVELPKLLDLLVSKRYAKDPEILFGAIGDAHSDQAPLQTGQFEADVRMVTHLTNLWLEGGGGGSGEESYELALYWLARHVKADAFTKRGHKGIAIIIGDEKTYEKVNAHQVRRIIGDNIERDIPVEDIIAEMTANWHVFMLIPQNVRSYGKDWSKSQWGRLIGPEHVIALDQPEGVCPAIAALVAACEGTRDLDDTVDDLKATGTSAAIVADVQRATSGFYAKNAMVRASDVKGDLPVAYTGPARTKRI